MDYTTTAEKAKVTLSAETLVIHALQSYHGIVGLGQLSCWYTTLLVLCIITACGMIAPVADAIAGFARYLTFDQMRKEERDMLYHAVTTPDDDFIWNAILEHEGQVFHTARGLEFSYHAKSNKSGEQLGELVIDRKEKTITRSTVLMAYQKALEVQKSEGKVTGPKKLGVFGASYLYPIFLQLGICTKE